LASGRPAGLVEAFEREPPGERAADLRVGKVGAVRAIERASLKLADRGATVLTLKLSRRDRKRIDAARKAQLTLTVTNGTRRVSRAFTLTT
jgi:hypothetical protein